MNGLFLPLNGNASFLAPSIPPIRTVHRKGDALRRPGLL